MYVPRIWEKRNTYLFLFFINFFAPIFYYFALHDHEDITGQNINLL